MTGTTYLEIGAALSFIFLLLSFFVTGINDTIFRFIRFRANHLKRFMMNMFFDPKWEKILHELMNTPYTNIIKKGKKTFPAEVPAKTFSASVVYLLSTKLDQAKASDEVIDKNPDADLLDTYRKALKEMTNGKGDFYLFLDSLLKRVDDVQEFTRELEAYYEGFIDRTAAWYKRRVAVISFWVALVVSVLLNVDSIEITKTLFKDKNARTQLSTMRLSKNDTVFEKHDSLFFATKVGKEIIVNMAIPGKRTDLSTDKPMADDMKSINTSYLYISKLSEMNVPIGWSNTIIKKPHGFGAWSLFLFLKLIGWIITAIASSYGAPIWFDLFKKLSPVKAIVPEKKSS